MSFAAEPSAQAIENAQPPWVPDLTFEQSLKSRGYRVLRGPGDEVGDPILTPSDTMVGFYQRLYGDKCLEYGFGLLRRLRGSVWRTQDGVELTAGQMTPSHASNLKLWLERRAMFVKIALQVQTSCQVADHDGGEMAHDEIEREADRAMAADALEILATLPLYKAICERASVGAGLRG